MRRGLARLLAAALMMALAAGLALVARDGWAWGRAIRAGDARASAAPVGAAAWTAHPTFPFQLARRALAVGDDLAFRRTMTLAIAAAKRPVDEKTLRQRAPIETELARIERGAADRSRASRAANALGVLLFTDPQDPSQQSGQTAAERALAEFRNAVTIDAGNETAKRNLELLLQQVKAQNPQGSHKPGGGQKAGNKGAGVGPPGHGF